MEYENKYSSKAVGGTALGLSIGAGVLALANNNGGLGNILGGGNNCKGASDAALTAAAIMAAGNSHPVSAPVYTRYDAEKDARIAELETEVKLRDSNIYTDSKILALYEKMDARISVVEREQCDQRTYNAVNTATIGCIQGQVATLLGLTKTVIPNGSICPGRGNVTVTPATTTT